MDGSLFNTTVCSLNINHERLASIPSKLLIKFHEGEFLTISVHPTEQQLLTKTVVILDNGNIRLVEQFLTIAYMN